MALDSLIAKANVGSGTDQLAGISTASGFVGAVTLTGSDGSQISTANPLPVTLPNMTAASYSQAGVIAINTDLLVIDCQGYEGVSIQCVSMGTTGVVTPAWSNNGTTYVAATILTVGGTSATVINAAGAWTTPVLARYLRLRLTTATTAGTTTLAAYGLTQAANFPVSSQPVTGSVTATAASSTHLIGDVGIQVRANATGAATVSKITAAAGTNATNVKATAGRVFGWTFYNNTAAIKVVRLYNLATAPTVGTSVPAYNVVIPPSSTVSQTLPVGAAHTTGIAYSITGAIADLDTTAVAANDVIGCIFYS